jgi:thioredoxin reductase
MTSDLDCDVVIVGGGPAGLSAGLFTARADLDTLLLNDGDPILRRNAHLENYPGFPAGVNSHRLLEMMGEQADRAGCDRQEARVVDLQQSTDGFVAKTEDGRTLAASNVVAATKNTVDFLADIDGVEILDRGKKFVDTDERGRTGVAGLYAAGRLAAQPHQAIIVAGHGATVGVTLIEDSDVDFYHDWVTPEGYFTERGRECPPGCAEIDASEREQREAESVAAIQEWVAAPPPAEPQQHPSVRDEE